MLRTLLTWRWFALTVIFLGLVPAMYFLGMWQFHRYQATNRSNRVTSANLTAQPVPIEQLSHPGGVVPTSEMYRHVTATGRFDVRGQFVVRNRMDSSGDITGFDVVTPLDLSDGEVVLVDRGWVNPNATDAVAYPSVPATPTGTVTVFGRLRPDETPATLPIKIHSLAGLPPHQFMMINSGEQSTALHQPVVAGYIEFVSSTPQMSAADSAEAIPGPTADAQTSDDLAVVGQGVHLPYAIQWWLFALMLPIGWWFLLRRDVRDRRKQGSDADTGTGAPLMTVAEYMAEHRAKQAAEAARS